MGEHWCPPIPLAVRDNPPYFQRLGEFIEQFAQLEVLLFYFHTKVCGIPITAARVAHAGTRVENMIEHLRQLLPPSDLAYMGRVLEQIKVINTTRNIIVHYASHPVSEGSRVTSDSHRIPDLRRPRAYEVSATTLEDMTADCRSIMLELLLGLSYGDVITRTRAEQDFPALGGAWRYTPQQGLRS